MTTSSDFISVNIMVSSHFSLERIIFYRVLFIKHLKQSPLLKRERYCTDSDFRLISVLKTRILQVRVQTNVSQKFRRLKELNGGGEKEGGGKDLFDIQVEVKV